MSFAPCDGNDTTHVFLQELVVALFKFPTLYLSLPLFLGLRRLCLPDGLVTLSPRLVQEFDEARAFV